MRKKKHPEHVNHERWLVSYADFITLLFAFFVVMFASSQVDSKKVGRFSESFSKAVGIEVFPNSGSSVMPGAPHPAPGETDGPHSDALPPELEGLKEELNKKKSEGFADLAGLTLVTRRNELVLRLSDTVLFDSGDDKLKPKARDVMIALAGELRKRKLSVRVEGHTDDKPIRTFRFRSNWDLSTARATAVVTALAAAQFEPDRLSAAGFAEFHPIVANDTPEHRATNRRVDLVVSVAVPAAEVKLDTIPEKTEESGGAAPQAAKAEEAKNETPSNKATLEEKAAETHDGHPAKSDSEHEHAAHEDEEEN